MFMLRLLSLCVLSTGMLAGNSVADEGKASNKPVVTKPALKDAASKPVAAEDESPKLEKMVKEMGVTYEKKKDTKTGATYFLIKEYGQDNYFFEIEESKSKNYTWVVLPCTKAPESGIPGEVMEKLLVENTRMGTGFFVYYPTNRMIMLKMPLATASLDAKSLKHNINWMLKDASRTRQLWDSTEWNKSTSSKE
ncbi:MAG: hypothetical protein JNJ77_00375 [Planctomycetia bacterium]|nr:hypothetical protein [Planctomycetia bacterium]